MPSPKPAPPVMVVHTDWRPVTDDPWSEMRQALTEAADRATERLKAALPPLPALRRKAYSSLPSMLVVADQVLGPETLRSLEQAPRARR